MQPSRSFFSKRSAAVAAALVFVAFAALLIASRTAPQAAAPVPQAPPGMLAAVDPETGALVQPTPEQVRELAAATDSPAAPGATRTWVLPDGTVGALVDESLHHYSVVHLDADGKLHCACLQGDAAAPPRRDLDPTTAAAPEE